MRRALISLAAVLLLAGCGNDPTPAPDIGAISAPNGFQPNPRNACGLLVRVPNTWRLQRGTAPQLFVTASGNGQIAAWCYKRSEPLPRTRAQLAATRRSLVAAVEARDPTFDLASSRLIMKSDLRAVEVVGVGTNHGVRRSVRSWHSYGHKEEVVVDAFAPVADFPRVDGQTFTHVLRSLRLRAPTT